MAEEALKNARKISQPYKDKVKKTVDETSPSDEAEVPKAISTLNQTMLEYIDMHNALAEAHSKETFEKGKIFFATLASASEVLVQSDKNGIADDAVSAVIPQAVIYIPFAELVDIEKEIQRLEKEEGRLEKELARVNGMLSNERFISKAPQAKIDEEKGKLEKYTQMMEQVKERLAQLR